MSTYRHGQAGTPLYRSWESMRWRVANLPRYAGANIDPRWATFEGFRDNPPTVADGRPHAPGLVLARIDDRGDYSPENARWRTRAENNREAKEAAVMVALPDGRFAIDVARENGIKQQTLSYRLNAGWPPERAATQPARPTHTQQSGHTA